MTGVPIDENAQYWTKAVGKDWSYGGYIGVPKLVVSKGLGVLTVAGMYSQVQDSDIKVLGGAVDIDIIDGGFVSPTLALRASYSMLQGVKEYDAKTYGLDLFLGKGIGPLTPYAAIGRMRTDSEGRIIRNGTTLFTLTDKADINRYTVGVRISLALPKLVLEASQAQERTYSAKLSVGF